MQADIEVRQEYDRFLVFVMNLLHFLNLSVNIF